MWQNFMVYAIVAVVAGLTAWKTFRMFAGRSAGCGGCSSSRSCGGGENGAGEKKLRPLSVPGCGCAR